MSKDTSTYCTPLTVQHENVSIKLGFCLSSLSFQDLKESLDQYLHPKEEEHFETLLYPRRQHSYLLGKYCAKQALGVYTNNSNFKNTSIEAGVFHQPIVVHSKHSNLGITISHSDTMGTAIAFPEACPMGIDIEDICESKVDSLETQLSAFEKKLIAVDEKALSLIQLWTVKEALSKVLKCGLIVPFELLEVEILEKKELMTLSHFRHFRHLEACSLLVNRSVLSIVYPKAFSLFLDGQAIGEFFKVQTK